MLAVKPVARHSRNIKLTCVSARSAVGHRKHKCVVFQRWVTLVSKFFAPDGFTASAVALRTTRLAHEALDHPMENHIVVIASLGMGGEVLYGFWALIGVELAVNLTLARVQHYFGRQVRFLLRFLGYGCLRLLVLDVSGFQITRLSLGEEKEPVRFQSSAKNCGICFRFSC